MLPVQFLLGSFFGYFLYHIFVEYRFFEETASRFKKISERQLEISSADLSIPKHQNVFQMTADKIFIDNEILKPQNQTEKTQEDSVNAVSYTTNTLLPALDFINIYSNINQKIINPNYFAPYNITKDPIAEVRACLTDVSDETCHQFQEFDVGWSQINSTDWNKSQVLEMRTNF